MTWISLHDGGLLNLEKCELIRLSNVEMPSQIEGGTRQMLAVTALMPEGIPAIKVFEISEQKKAEKLMDDLAGLVGTYNPETGKMASYPPMPK